MTASSSSSSSSKPMQVRSLLAVAALVLVATCSCSHWSGAVVPTETHSTVRLENDSHAPVLSFLDALPTNVPGAFTGNQRPVTAARGSRRLNESLKAQTQQKSSSSATSSTKTGTTSNVKGQRGQTSNKRIQTTSSTGTRRRRLNMSSSKNSKRSILQFLFDKKDFEDLFELIIRVGLAGALESPGPFTVFAPTNDAFDNGLPTPLVLGADIDIGKLLFKEDAFIPHTRNFVLNHVLGGQVLAADISNGLVAGTFAGEAIGFNIATDPYSSQTSLFANGVQVTKTDQIQNNGVVHTLGGGVLNPSWVFSSVAFRAVQIAETSVLFALLGLAGIDLTGPGEFTLIAPVNAAFTALPESTQNCLVDPLNVVALQQVLAFHVLKGVITAADFQDGTKYKTLEGGKVKVTLDPFLFEGIANPLALDILANNGVVHLIGAVLDPGTVCDFQRPKQGGGGGSGSGSGKMSSKGDKRRRSRH